MENQKQDLTPIRRQPRTSLRGGPPGIYSKKEDANSEGEGGGNDEFIMPEPPYDLNEEAKAEFERIVPLLNQGLDLAVIDLRMVAIFCNEIVKYWRCEKVLTEKGLTMETSTGYQAQRPEVSIGKNALMSARAIAEQYGLTVMSRKKIFSHDTNPKTRTNRGFKSKVRDNWAKLGTESEKSVSK